MSIWDDPELKTGGDYFKFDNVGDSIAGTITATRKHKFEDGKVASQLILATDSGEERTVTAGQVRLAVALQEQRPEIGDHITITYTNKEARQGGKTLKHFDVTVRRAGTPAAAPATARTAAVDPDGPPPGVDAAVWKAMDAIQRDKLRAALGLA